jgi:hypothetical protein
MIVEMPDHQIINEKSGLALEYDVDDERLYTRTPAKKTHSQKWQLTLLDDGSYQIRNLGVNQVLGLKRSGDTGPAICVQGEDLSDRGQHWKLEHMHGYLYKVKNAKSEEYLEVPSEIQTRRRHKSASGTLRMSHTSTGGSFPHSTRRS